VIAKACLLAFIGLVVASVIWMSSNYVHQVNECSAKGGELVRLYNDHVKCVDISKITLD
jgi:hypothetical protein